MSFLKNVNLIIFDIDNTLIQSEHINVEIIKLYFLN